MLIPFKLRSFAGSVHTSSLAPWPDLARFPSDFRPPAGLSTSSRYSVRPLCTVFGRPYR